MENRKIYRDADNVAQFNLSNIPLNALSQFLGNFRESLIEKIALDTNDWSSELFPERREYTLGGFAMLRCEQGTKRDKEVLKQERPIRVEILAYAGKGRYGCRYLNIAYGEGDNTREAYEDLQSVLAKFG